MKDGNYAVWAKKERGLTGKFKAIPDIKPTREEWISADDLARKLGYAPADVHDVAEIIAPFLAAWDRRARKTTGPKERI